MKKKASDNAELVEKEDVEAGRSEKILLTPSWIDSTILYLLGDYFKATANSEIGESADIESVIKVYIENDEVL